MAPAFLPSTRNALVVPALPAALGTDINAVHSSVNIRGLKQAKHVTDGHTDQTDHHCSFSFRSRMMNFSEVPPKPKASRIRFSRYLV